MRILIMGASGYLGSTMYKKLKECTNEDILGTCCKFDNEELLQIDALNTLDIKKVLSFKPDIIIWSIMNQEKEMFLSQIGLNAIVNNISKNVRLIYISTTVGKGKDQTESVIPYRRTSDQYLSEYVNGKIEGESIVQRHTNYVIVRPGSIYGYNCDGEIDSRMKGLRELSKTGKDYSRTANMYVSFINVQDLANAIIELAYSKFTGIINISAEKPVSHYDFNIYLASLMNINNSFIVPNYKKEEVYHNLNNDKRKSLINTVIQDI